MESVPAPEGAGEGGDSGRQPHEEAHPEPARLNPMAFAKLRLVSGWDMSSSLGRLGIPRPPNSPEPNGGSLPESGHTAAWFRISRWESVLLPK